VDPRLFEPYERLIQIQLLDHTVEVPENNRVLRCFQFLDLHGIAHGRFCWNDECGLCEIVYRQNPQAAPRPSKACQLKVRPGLEVLALSAELRFALRRVLRGRPARRG
jgi:hypothetical protein